MQPKSTETAEVFEMMHRGEEELIQQVSNRNLTRHVKK